MAHTVSAEELAAGLATFGPEIQAGFNALFSQVADAIGSRLIPTQQAARTTQAPGHTDYTQSVSTMVEPPGGWIAPQEAANYHARFTEARKREDFIAGAVAVIQLVAMIGGA